MKHFLLSFLCSIIGLFSAVNVSAEDITRLTFNFTDGEPRHFHFSEAPSMSFNGDDLILTRTGEPQVTLSLASIASFEFTRVDAGIDGVVAELAGASVQFMGEGKIAISGCSEGTVLSVTDIAGRQLEAIKMKDGENVVDLAKYPCSVLIISVAGKSFKLLNR